MRQKATVSEIKDGKTYIKVTRASMCDGCHSKSGCSGHCDISGLIATGGEMTAAAENKIGARVGDKVEVETGSDKVLFYAALVFVLPIVAAGIFYALSGLISSVEWVGYASAFAGFALTFCAVCLYDRRKRGAEPEIKIVRILDGEDEMQF